MSHQIKANYSQDFLLPPSLEDWIPSDHPSRFIREFIQSLDLRKLGFKVETSEEGRPYYSSDLLLKAWLYGYFHRIRSSRKLEKHCKDNVSLIWLTGMNYPDHNTLWRFWNNNKLRLRDIFKESLNVAKKLDLIDMSLNALDGTKIKAYSSKQGVMNKKKLETLLEKLDDEINNIEKEIEDNQESESGEYSLPSELQDKETLKKKIKEVMEELKVIDRENIHPKENEARMMRSSGTIDLSYNAQAVVDSKHQIIVGTDVINKENDTESLVPMIDKVKELTQRKAETTLADSGYATGEQIHQAQEKEFNVLLNLTSKSNISTNPRKDKLFHSSNFKYDKERDVMICPESKELEYFQTGISKNKKHKVKKYKCNQYESCSSRWECSKAKTGRTVKLNPFYESIERQKLKQLKSESHEKLKRRKSLIEPIFGNIKEINGFRRFTMKGLENAKTQWSMICTSINLQKMHKIWAKGEVKFT
ncbi:MAG: IS1182 family transposase [Bacteroidetes bacterium]|nr:IS1182 family transposase [Bacteroidota bacterium]